MANDLVSTLADLEEKEALAIAQERLNAGDDPLNILSDTRRALEIVGQRFEKSEYFIPDLIYSGEILREISEMVRPMLTGAVEARRLGKVVIGTVYGDIHNIGKNMVATLMTAEGFSIHDVGINVTAEQFIEAIKEYKADILAMSALLTTTAQEQRKVIETLKKEGLRDRVKIMVGGGAMTQEFADSIGADGYDPTAPGAARLARRLVGK